MPTMDPATSLQTAEQALRDLIRTVFTREHGANWMEQVVDANTLATWRAVRAQEARQRTGHLLSGVSDLEYAFLGDLVMLIRKKGHWHRLFEPVLGEKDQVFALLALLEWVRRPLDHARPLLPYEEDLASGISGYIRNRVTIFLSSQDEDGDYYPRIERIEDNFGNAFVAGQSSSAIATTEDALTRLTVGDVLTFHCSGTDPQNRELRWWTETVPQRSDASGTEVTLTYTLQPTDTGTAAIMIALASSGPYHRNLVQRGVDAYAIFQYSVRPPA